MALYWIARTIDDKPAFFIVEATGGESALIKSGIAGFTGPRSEVIRLDAAMERRVPKKMIGRVLGQKEAAALLDRIGSGKRKKAARPKPGG